MCLLLSVVKLTDTVTTMFVLQTTAGPLRVLGLDHILRGLRQDGGQQVRAGAARHGALPPGQGEGGGQGEERVRGHQPQQEGPGQGQAAGGGAQAAQVAGAADQQLAQDAAARPRPAAASRHQYSVVQCDGMTK